MENEIIKYEETINVLWDENLNYLGFEKEIFVNGIKIDEDISKRLLNL